MLVRRLETKHDGHTVSVGESITFLVTDLAALGLDDMVVTLRFSDMRTSQPKVAIDAPTSVRIDHNKGPLRNGP